MCNHCKPHNSVERTNREPKITKSVAPHIDDEGTNDLKFTHGPCVMTPSSHVCFITVI